MVANWPMTPTKNKIDHEHRFGAEPMIEQVAETEEEQDRQRKLDATADVGVGVDRLAGKKSFTVS